MFSTLVEDLVGQHLAINHRLINFTVDNLLKQHIRRLAAKLVLFQSNVVQNIFLSFRKTPELFNLSANLLFIRHSHIESNPP